MLVVISPAKRLDPAPVGGINPTAPAFQEDAVHLAAVASALSPAELTKLMHISDKLARLNADRFRDFAAAPAPEAVKPAVLLFAGDTYAGFEAASLDADDLRFAQDRLRILSGLYGLLRPLDAIQPHRLEMGSRGRNPLCLLGPPAGPRLERGRRGRGHRCSGELRQPGIFRRG